MITPLNMANEVSGKNLEGVTTIEGAGMEGEPKGDNPFAYSLPRPYSLSVTATGAGVSIVVEELRDGITDASKRRIDATRQLLRGYNPFKYSFY